MIIIIQYYYYYYTLLLYYYCILVLYIMNYLFLSDTPKVLRVAEDGASSSDARALPSKENDSDFVDISTTKETKENGFKMI